MSEEPSRPRNTPPSRPPQRKSSNGGNGGGQNQKKNRQGKPSHPPQHQGQRHDPKQPEDPVVGKILEIANQTVEAIGTGFPEEFYGKLFAHLLGKSSLQIQVKPRGVMKHREKVADEFVPDFLIEKSVVLDVRSTSGDFTPEQLVATGSTQKFFNARHGLLLSFAGKEVRHHRLRIGNDPFPTIPHEEILRGNTVEKHDEMRATMLCRSIQRIGRAQGLGFCQRTYRGLLRVEFDAESLDYQDEPSVKVASNGLELGETTLKDIMIVQRSGALLVLAQQDGIRPADRARMRAALKYLKLPWGLIVHFGKRRFEWQWEK